MKTTTDLRLVLNDDGEDISWQAQAACRTYDHIADIWFPETLNGRERRHMPVATRHAKLICASCDVSETCLAYAIEHHEQHGIWGGLTPDERKTLWKGRNT